MEISSLGFIGAGNMNTAILQGVLRAGAIPREQIWLSNRHKEKLEPFPGQAATPPWTTGKWSCTQTWSSSG